MGVTEIRNCYPDEESIAQKSIDLVIGFFYGVNFFYEFAIDVACIIYEPERPFIKHLPSYLHTYLFIPAFLLAPGYAYFFNTEELSCKTLLNLVVDITTYSAALDSLVTIFYNSTCNAQSKALEFAIDIAIESSAVIIAFALCKYAGRDTATNERWWKNFTTSMWAATSFLGNIGMLILAFTGGTHWTSYCALAFSITQQLYPWLRSLCQRQEDAYLPLLRDDPMQDGHEYKLRSFSSSSSVATAHTAPATICAPSSSTNSSLGSTGVAAFKSYVGTKISSLVSALSNFGVWRSTSSPTNKTIYTSETNPALTSIVI